jgi:hypothetical protein
LDEVAIQKIAAEVVRHLPSYPWVLLAVQLVLTLAAAGIGSFLGEYLRTRGKNLATKADFDSLQNQLRANTELVETIKAEVGQKEWARREWANLRRTKLEALLDKMHDCEVHRDRLRHKTFYIGISTDPEPSERDPVSELSTIAELYFPELLGDAYEFISACRSQLQLGYALMPKLVGMIDPDARKTALTEYSDMLDQTTLAIVEAQNTLAAAARRLLVEIMGVDEHP